jgi:hypothetical protein
MRSSRLKLQWTENEGSVRSLPSGTKTASPDSVDRNKSKLETFSNVVSGRPWLAKRPSNMEAIFVIGRFIQVGAAGGAGGDISVKKSLLPLRHCTCVIGTLVLLALVSGPMVQSY